MKKSRPIVSIAILSLLATPLAAPAEEGSASPIAPGAKVEKLAGDSSSPKARPPMPTGTSTSPTSRTTASSKWSTDGKLITFLQPCGRSNGLCFDRQRNLLGLRRREERAVVASRPTGKTTTIVKDYKGKLLNGPNDLWVRPDGGLYFTRSVLQAAVLEPRTEGAGGRGVYYLSPDRKTLRRVADDLKQPNGIIGTPDGKTLYVADIGAGKTYVYDIAADGSARGQEALLRAGLRRHDHRHATGTST